MTGYGHAEISVDGVSLEVRIKSVNGRYLEIRQHLPKIYLPIELEIQKIAKKIFSRGTVDIFVQRTVGTKAQTPEVHFQTKVAEVWLKSFRAELKKLKVAGDVAPQDLLTHIPGYFQMEESQGLSPKEQQGCLKVIEKAMEECQRSREKEGAFLQKVCSGALADLEKNRGSLVTLRDQFVTSAPQKYQDRLQKLLGDVSVDPSRLLQEVGHMVERFDIEEELQRLGEHIKNVKALIVDKTSQGKKLDFYAQELLREINTIGSKSPSAKITEIIVSTKNIIEQFREQIQNIE